MFGSPAAARTVSPRADRNLRRTLGAIVLVLVLAGSGVLLAGYGTAGAGAALAPPLIPSHGATGILSGAQLQKATVQSQPGTPLTSLSNVTIFLPIDPGPP